MKKPIIGLTGIYGSGKSRVAQMLAARGAIIVDMDQAGRWAVEQNAAVREALRHTFGDDVFDGEQLNRKKLGAIVFGDQTALAELNRIVHPVMLKRVEEEIETAMRSGGDFPYLVVDAALLFELNFDKKCDLTVVVAAPLELCIRRAQARDGLSRDQVLARIRSQLSQQEKINRADWVIENDGSEQELEKRVERFHKWLLKK